MGFPNKAQLEFINEPLNDMSLLGIPGGGKTTTIIHKIVKLFNEYNYKRDYFLLLSFSNAACNDFKIKGNKIKKIFSDKNVKTLHSLSGSLNNMIETHNFTKTNLSTTIFRSYLNIRNNKINLTNNKYLQNCKVIFLDEAQDISQEQYDFIMEIKLQLNIPLILVGDINQNIFQFQGGNDKFLKEHPGKKFILTENNRSTEEIVNFIDALKPCKDLTGKMISTKGRGNTP